MSTRSNGVSATEGIRPHHANGSLNGASPTEVARGVNPGTQMGSSGDAARRARYSWAAQAVGGKDVLEVGCGVDFGTEILASGGASRVIGVDLLHDLDLPDRSFDVVVCFEAIETIEECEPALGEFHRVLRPGGLLFMASPDADSYRLDSDDRDHGPTKLAAVVGERFANVKSFRQPEREAPPIVAASDHDLPTLRDPQAEDARSATEGELLRAVAQANEREMEARIRLQEAGAALLETNQALARFVLERRRFQAHIDVLEGSRSWRYMGFFRRLRHMFRPRG